MTTERSNQPTQKRSLTMAFAVKIWPDLETADMSDQRRGLGVILSAVYGWLIFGVTFFWLISDTRLLDLRNHWVLIAIFIPLRIIAGQLDLTSLLLNDVSHSRGSAARFITWSAALIIGPIALWLDVIAILVAAIISWSKKQYIDSSNQARYWEFASQLPTISVRDTFPALVALALLYPPETLASITQGQFLLTGGGLYATLLKIGLTVLLMVPLHLLDIVLINQPTGFLSGLLITLRSLRFGFGALISLGFPDLLGLLAVGFYSIDNYWTFIFVLTVFTFFALFVHYLNLRGLQSRSRLEKKEKLENLNQALFSEGPDDRDFPTVLSHHLPMLFPDCRLEITLIGSDVLFIDDVDQPLLDLDMFDRLGNSGRSYVEVQFHSENNLIGNGLIVPINGRENQQLIGAIALVPGQSANGLNEVLPTLFSLSSLLASYLHQIDLFENALTSQAEAFHEEIFAQAYEAEMTIAYQQVSQELALAGQIQNSFLPDSVPDIPGWQITVTLEPAHETSGDYYDFIALPDGLFGLLIADVTDKGIGASLYMALSRTLIRTFALEFFREPAKVLEAANRRILQDSKSDLFVTVCYLVLDPVEGQIVYCNAGHNPPFLWSRQGSNEPLRFKRTALPLGLFEAEEWQHDTIHINPGDILALYTDGVTEAQDEDGHFFGEDRLKKVIDENLDKSALIIEDKILSALSNFTGDAPQSDDLTLMIIRRE
jgi:serine phosphatase RsbU (regulator of sigma subunit)